MAVTQNVKPVQACVLKIVAWHGKERSNCYKKELLMANNRMQSDNLSDNAIFFPATIAVRTTSSHRIAFVVTIWMYHIIGDSIVEQQH